MLRVEGSSVFVFVFGLAGWSRRCTGSPTAHPFKVSCAKALTQMSILSTFLGSSCDFCQALILL